MCVYMCVVCVWCGCWCGCHYNFVHNMYVYVHYILCVFHIPCDIHVYIICKCEWHIATYVCRVYVKYVCICTCVCRSLCACVYVRTWCACVYVCSFEETCLTKTIAFFKLIDIRQHVLFQNDWLDNSTSHPFTIMYVCVYACSCVGVTPF